MLQQSLNVLLSILKRKSYLTKFSSLSAFKSIYKHNAEKRTDPVGINFLVPVTYGSCVSNLKSVISEHMLRIKFMRTEIALRWMPLIMSTLVQAMAFCLTAPSPYLSQRWPTSMSPYAYSNWAIIGSGNGLSQIRRQVITWTNDGLLSFGLLGTNFSEFESEFYHFHLIKCIWKSRLPTRRPFCSRGDELNGFKA